MDMNAGAVPVPTIDIVWVGWSWPALILSLAVALVLLFVGRAQAGSFRGRWLLGFSPLVWAAASVLLPYPVLVVLLVVGWHMGRSTRNSVKDRAASPSTGELRPDAADR